MNVIGGNSLARLGHLLVTALCCALLIGTPVVPPVPAAAQQLVGPADTSAVVTVVRESAGPDAGDPVRPGQDGDVSAIIEKVQANLRSARDLELTVHMTIVNSNGSPTEAAGRLLGLLPNLFRVEFLKPSMLAGVTLVVDIAKNEARQYHPVTDQIVVQPWDRLARERGLEIDFERWIGLPDPDQYAFRRLADQEHAGGTYIVLEGVPRDPASTLRYEFFIDPERWWVERIRLFHHNEERLIFSARITELTVDQGLTEQRLRELPLDAEVIYR